MTIRKRRFLLLIILFVVLIGAGTTYYFIYYKSDQEETKPVLKEKEKPVEPTPTTIEAALDGTIVSSEVANRHPVAVMVENLYSTAVRPQTGLTDASIVYEATAEGGITRFMAVYGPKMPAKVGPVRSARSYYVDWAQEYDAFYAHWGGAPDALKKITTDGVKDLNAMKLSSNLFWRISGVGSPHNGYTNIEKLYGYGKSKGWSATGSFTKYTFKDDVLEAERPAGGTLTLDFSGSSAYSVKYIYDPKTNSYLRFMAGSAHKDKVSGVQITAKNIIVQLSKHTARNDGKNRIDITTIGSGTAKIYLDGKEIVGTWKKTATKERTIFYDASGNPIIYNRGQTWIEVLEIGRLAKWTP